MAIISIKSAQLANLVAVPSPELTLSSSPMMLKLIASASVKRNLTQVRIVIERQYTAHNEADVKKTHFTALSQIMSFFANDLHRLKWYNRSQTGMSHFILIC